MKTLCLVPVESFLPLVELLTVLDEDKAAPQRLFGSAHTSRSWQRGHLET